MKVPCIALLTDFGLADHYAASLKAVILNINRRAVVVDISHEIPSFDVRAAAFELLAACSYFPLGTVFVTVVDPGVGSARKILLARTRKYAYIGPDNGVLTPALTQEKVWRAWSVENPRYFLPRPSRTFEGRDKMAPAAAWLSRGAALESFGPRVSDIRKLAGGVSEPQASTSEITGGIIHADKFGNLTTNIPGEMLVNLAGRRAFGELEVRMAGKKRIGVFRENYGASGKGELFFLVGSLGLVEISAREAAASRKIPAGRGDSVRIVRHG